MKKFIKFNKQLIFLYFYGTYIDHLSVVHGVIKIKTMIKSVISFIHGSIDSIYY